MVEDFIKNYDKKVKSREKMGIPPLSLNEEETKSLIEILKKIDSSDKNKDFLLDLFSNKINPSVSDETKLKADFLQGIIFDKFKSAVLTKKDAIDILGTMIGGYNVAVLVTALKELKDDALLEQVANTLGKLSYVYDEFNEVAALSKDNKYAKLCLENWAEAKWFTTKKEVPASIKVRVFKVDGELNTDDLSPAQDAFTRSDIPLHALAMLKNRIKDFEKIIKKHQDSKQKVAFVGDVMGTGSSRKSAVNSLCWKFGEEIPNVPNKKNGAVILGTMIAPIFYNTAIDSGCLPIEVDVENLKEDDEVEISIKEKAILKDGKKVVEFTLEDSVLESYRAGGRLPLLVGKKLTSRAREFLGLGESDVFVQQNKAEPKEESSDGGFFGFLKPKKESKKKGYTLAQKMVGKACNKEGVRANEYCEPKMTTVGSQDTTGAMTRDEVKELACLKYNADLVLQSFCHTAAYPKKSDIDLQKTLPGFMVSRGGLVLKPGDGVIHSWLNKVMLPDTVGTGGDSHTRFPIGISFPGGSGIVAFAATTGYIPLTMPESVRVRFTGKLREGITTRDIVNAIPYFAIKNGLVTIEKKNKKNIFNGRVMEIEGLEDLSVMEAFEISDASAERSCSGCAINLSEESIKNHLNHSIEELEELIKEGYESRETIKKRIDDMKAWLKNPTLLRADKDAEYVETIDIDLNDITEPILSCPNDPDNVHTLSEVLSNDKMPHKIDEVFVGSCMTKQSHFESLAEVLDGSKNIPTRLWVVPPTRMVEKNLKEAGQFAIFAAAGARTETPGCSLCMGNQARVADNATVFSTSTRNFDNRMGMGAQVYLGSAELAGVCAILGKLPTVEEYKKMLKG